MKKLLLSTAALGAMAGSAMAGGIAAPVIEPEVAPVVMPAPVGAWQGGYVGANLNWGKAGIDGVAEDLDGAGIALRGGYDWQNGKTVFGLGAEHDFGEVKQTIGGVESKIKDKTSLFARVGYDAGAWLPYASLGYTWAKAEAAGASENIDGYTLGLGVERSFTPNWAGYAEINHTDFGTVAGGDTDMQKLRLGVNYRF